MSLSKDHGLYVVATHIGNLEDVTLRAIRILKEADYVICEERKVGARLLRQLDIKNTVIELNEHNERETTRELIKKWLMTPEKVALISDAGTPLFADPGRRLVWQCHQNGIPVHPVPGACSIITALMGSGIIEGPFQYYGFLPPNREEREEAIKKIRSNQGIDMIFLEAPYRLKQLLRDFTAILGKERFAVVAYKLTYPEEKIFWGKLSEIKIMTEDLPKGEFVLILPKKKKKFPYPKKKR